VEEERDRAGVSRGRNGERGGEGVKRGRREEGEVVVGGEEEEKSKGRRHEGEGIGKAEGRDSKIREDKREKEKKQ